MARLDGRAAAVTGGASGIGEATARRLAEEGALVAIADIDAERGRVVADEIRAKGGRAIFVETHTGRESERVRFVRAAHAEFGRLDVLVNNAGMRLYQTVVDASEESWDAILAVNVKGYAFCAKAAIPLMRQTGGGSIVNVASIRSVVAGGNMVQYDTTKAAVAGLTRAMAFDHAGEGIRVNAVFAASVVRQYRPRLTTVVTTVATKKRASSRPASRRRGREEAPGRGDVAFRGFQDADGIDAGRFHGSMIASHVN